MLSTTLAGVADRFDVALQSKSKAVIAKKVSDGLPTLEVPPQIRKPDLCEVLLIQSMRDQRFDDYLAATFKPWAASSSSSSMPA